ncbi:glutamate synthase (NADPH/NADH) large chain [Actinomycetospora succinea]|uniref:Glutamate synthase (NADPH/NADH) large chain n=1 Tax=Actinomycetospora succinea TaxID=663603 RepID=A0A4R6UW13_9PSEU|nr:glutamate synthase large subunit [Actinomycetospora succinea]TDQ50053.1 glutamate synthase (NADPH/NADH) large chain [Actinomycetospora succinea]
MSVAPARPQGLYDPAYEHDACGVGAVAHARGEQSHGIVRDALTVLHNLDHRGAAGSEPTSGDGAGILVQVPDALLRASVEFALPQPVPSPDGGAPVLAYATGLAFLPADPDRRAKAVSLLERVAGEEGLEVLGWREVPVDPEGADVGSVARGAMPHFAQLVVATPDRSVAGIALDRLAWILRKRVERQSQDEGHGVYIASLSSRTMTYKGMLTTDQLPLFFPDLRDERLVSAIAVVHSRFSTNTFPSWPLAHPYRCMAHNGEINTIRGNRNRMRAREALLGTDLFPGDLQRAMPVCPDDVSDSASFDEVLELLALGGRPLPHAVMMMMPEAWENHAEMPADQRDFYRFHATLMEPWDGPAAVVFTDGTVMGATLDRNGLRPARWWQLADDRVVLASESGVLDIPPDQVLAKGRLRPGRMFLVDTRRGEVVDDDAYKSELAAAEPYGEWLHAGLIRLDELPAREHVVHTHDSVMRRQQIFGYTEEEQRILLAPMATTGAEPLGSMGTDTPVAALSRRARLLYDYFVQLFAQVTNPPLDAIREELVTSMARAIGPEQNLFHPGPASCRQVVLPEPVIDNDELAKLVHIDDDGDMPGFAATVISGLYEVDGGEQALRAALDRVRRESSEAIAAGRRILVLSDRDSDEARAPIPALLLVSAVHHHLVATRERTQVALVAETGDAREVHHVALLLGYGAAAVNPYLAFESIEDMIGNGWMQGVEVAEAIARYVGALVKGVRKVMSKMGISTVSGYTAAQAFEALGLSQDFVDEFFTGTSSKLGGGGLDLVAREAAERHRRAYPDNPGERTHRKLEVGGEYAYRREGELHLFSPETVFLLQHSTRTKQWDMFQRYTAEADRLIAEGGALRGMFRLRTEDRVPVPLEEVEPATEIVKRFATGAMSYGSISAEAHTDLAIAMNNVGGKSNTGEGGEDPVRLHDPSKRSSIKQVASGRFGVTSEYLVNATDIQIKMAQGAKPGEGGQLAGQKVYPWIAEVRYSTPGVGLISPPPHHDIYSIEDLKQLIHDLKNANEHARIHVKLVSSVGVGTVAAGVAKAHSDVVLISGYEGGTGAAPLTSLKHAGSPWEIGLADTQQTLMINGLRDRITVQVDGQMKTGRDVIIGALLGAEEYGFSTAPLVVNGCIMMRVCHLDTCPVGVATQNPELRKRYTGKPEFVENFFWFIAEEVREHLAALGFRSLDEAIGHAELIDGGEAIENWKARGIDLTPLFAVPDVPEGAPTDRIRTRPQDHGLDRALDRTLMQLAEGAIADGDPVRLELPVRNVNRTVGTLTGAEITRRHGDAGLPDDTLHVELTGSAGQSFGAFLPPGMTLDLVGDANDYLAKGLSGGRVIARPHPDAPFTGGPDEQHVIAGNVIAYGATGGEVFLRGQVGERFCVRNSGALAVVEGTGDHACEYMTGGRVVVLGTTGRNLGAGMSGGVAFVLDLPAVRVNPEMVSLEAPDDEDADWLHSVVERHRELTGSPRAAHLLADWDDAVRRFTKVMPDDFRRVLDATQRAQAEGRDPDEVIMEVAAGG